jgi:hypothetical protein
MDDPGPAVEIEHQNGRCCPHEESAEVKIHQHGVRNTNTRCRSENADRSGLPDREGPCRENRPQIAGSASFEQDIAIGNIESRIPMMIMPCLPRSEASRLMIARGVILADA